MRQRTRYQQGIFIPQNKEKYVGHKPCFRSSWEKKFMMWADRHPNVLEWSSEGVCVEYADPTRPGTGMHRYFIDFRIKVRSKTGGIDTLWVEIKPASQSRPPVRGRKSEKTFITESLTFARNQAKWKYATEAAKQRGARFVVLTEENLK